MSALQAGVSGFKASRSFTAEERKHGFEPSFAQQFGAGAVNAGSTFIDNSMAGIPGLIVGMQHNK